MYRAISVKRYRRSFSLLTVRRRPDQLSLIVQTLPPSSGGGRTTADRSAHGRPTSSVVLASLAKTLAAFSSGIRYETS